MSYDSFGRLDTLAHTRGGTDLASFAYGYNALGGITQIAELTKTRDFTYDALLRLTSGGTASTPESYSYDAEGNRTVSHLSAAHTTDAANRLLEDDSFTYVYDANGNLTRKTDKATQDFTDYSWDTQDQLTRIDFPDLSIATYIYDGFGRRIEKAANGATTRYVYDGEDILLEYDGANALQARFTHSQRTDQPLAMERGATLAYFQADHLGSVRQITNAAGIVVNAYNYDSYGSFESQSETLAQPYAFTGHEYDAESGLLYYRARYYDSVTGRFISEDPIGFSGVDSNLYRYAFSDPIGFLDPSGLTPAGEEGAAASQAATKVPVFSAIGGSLKCLFEFALSGVQIALASVAPEAAILAAVPLPGICKLGVATKAATFTTSALKRASDAAFKAARNVKDFKVPAKHLPGAGGRWAKFADDVDPSQVIKQALESPNAKFLPNNVQGSFRTVTDLGKVVGSKGQTGVRVVIGRDGKIWSAFPVR